MQSSILLKLYRKAVSGTTRVSGEERTSDHIMMQLYESIEPIFEGIIQYAILLIECIGVAVLLYTIFRAVVDLFQRDPTVKLSLAEGFALSLEFKMGGELLRTVIVREWKELLILGAVILLRAALTFLIHWEINIETKKEFDKPAESREPESKP